MPTKADQAKNVLEQIEWMSERRKLYRYKPYGHPDTLCPHGALWKERYEAGEWTEWSNKPWQLDFHNAGADHQERMLMAANRPGKSLVAAMEVAFHMTGDYPDWWKGKRFDKPVYVWTASPTNESSRDVCQKYLLGGTDPETIGTGCIPYEKIAAKPRMRQCGVGNVVDEFRVKHKSGGYSICNLKSYEQGWRKFQGTEPHIVWLDEEPEDASDQKRIYSECLTRLLTSHGIMMVTFTPLLGQTQIVEHFMQGGEGVWLETATWEDAPHLKKEERERLKQSYPSYEVEARTQGVPMLGEGRIFDTPEEDIRIEPFDIPPHYARIIGLDFGLDHPTAAAFCAWDRDRDVFYVYDIYRKDERDTLYHAEAIRRRGDDWIPVAWPHDGAQREKSSGKQLQQIYKDHGLNMLGRSARYDNDVGGAQPQWPIISEIQERCATDRLKVFSTCTEFFEEYRQYHTKDGKIVSRNDDALKAMFYALMMKRFAATRTQKRSSKPQAPIFTTRV